MSESLESLCAGTVEHVKEKGCVVVTAAGSTIAVFYHDGQLYAVDNRCPHMGFPLSRGSIKDGILTCEWHHARFDLKSGGTFDQFADDVRVFPVDIREGTVWVHARSRADLRAYYRQRLQDGLEQAVRLVLAKAVLVLQSEGERPAESFRIGLDFGVLHRQSGWGQGLTLLTCLTNILPHLDAEDRPLALYHGLSAVAQDCQGQPPRFPLHPLPTATADLSTLKRWFRQFIAVRDEEGAERCLASAIHAGAEPRQIADILFAAATDHRYLDVGHVLDFTNKALEALDIAGWDLAEPVLTSLVQRYARGQRAEETSSWRHPVDLVAILDQAFAVLPDAVSEGFEKRGSWRGRDSLVPILLGEDPRAIAEALLGALRSGANEQELAATVAYAAALRIARFPTSNEFGDWDTALHTFTFANSVHQALLRSPSIELLRGVFDEAMSVYVDRFLNVPAAPLPESSGENGDPKALLHTFLGLLDRQQQVNEAAKLVAHYLAEEGDVNWLLASMGKALLREDRNFHTIQMVEAAFKQSTLVHGTAAEAHILIAAARYLAAHSPTVRSQEQTYNIALRLHRGESVHSEIDLIPATPVTHGHFERVEPVNLVGNLCLRQEHPDLTLELEIANIGKAPATLVKLENIAQEGLEIDKQRVNLPVDRDFINMKGTRLDYMKTLELKIPLRPKRKGTFELRPRLLFTDEKGNYRSFEFEAATLVIRELGTRGWLKGV